MTDLVEFLTAQYDRIEEKARSASERAATWDVNGMWHLEGVEHAVVGEEEAFCHPHNVEHITWHDPAYVLADIAAKRRILERHASCDDTSFGDPCEDLRDLAAPFSAEPGYDAERWAV